MGRIYKPWPLENLWWSVIKGKDKLEFCQPGHLSSYQWPGNYSWNCICICRLIMSTKHSMDRNRKAINHSDLDPWSPNNKLANFLTVPSYLSYGISKENVYMYQVGRVSFFFLLLLITLMLDFVLCWDFKVRLVHKGFCPFFRFI